MAQPNKGYRKAILARTAPDVYDAVRIGARDHGMSTSDYVAMILARTHDLPQFAPPAHPAPDQGELLINVEGARLKQTA